MSDYIIINDDLRTMQIPSSIVLLGVESDDDVNKIQFKMPKEYCGFDLSTFSARINYMNANGDGDVYVVDDLAVDGDDPSLMTFTWLVGRNACKYKGNTKFIVCLKLFDGDNVIKEFNTTVYSLPVLEGLETTEAVEQQNADIIQYLINLIEQSGGADLSNYYTKQEVDELIPTKLPNPEKLTINGSEYDGSEPVDLTIEASSEIVKSAEGKVIHINDAVPEEAIQSLALYDEDDTQLSEGTIAIANKNLFRIDEIAAQVVSKGITFTKNADGSITCNGTSTGTYPMTSCVLDKNMFEIGKTYTLSTGKNSGFTYCQLIMNYADGTTDYIVARNSPRAFTISKEVSSCTASVQLTDSGVTVSNEVVYPMLEIGSVASAFVNNTYTEINFDGSVMPVLPTAICNIWSNDDAVANITMQYEADTVLGKVDDYANENLHVTLTAASVAAQHDGARTVSLVSVDEANSTLDIIDQYVEDKKEEIDEYIAEVEGELGETVAQHSEEIAALQSDSSRLFDKTSALQKQIDNITEAEDLIRTVEYKGGENAVPANISKYGEVSKLRGVSVAYNQLMQRQDATGFYVDGGSAVNGSDGGVVITPSEAGNGRRVIITVAGHKYFHEIEVKSDLETSLERYVQANSSPWGSINTTFVSRTTWQTVGSIIEMTSSAQSSGGQTRFGLKWTNASVIADNKYYMRSNIVHDLTQMFGSSVADYLYSIEQATTGAGVALFKALVSAQDNSHETGRLVSTIYEAVKSEGVNWWNEQFDKGTIDGQTGQPAYGSYGISKDLIPILPNTTYYFLRGSYTCWLYYYDENENFITGLFGATNYQTLASGTNTFTTPPNAYYMRWLIDTSYGYTYNDDIQIALDSSAEKGTHHAYVAPATLPLPTSVTLRGILKVVNNALTVDGDEYEPETGEIDRNYGIVTFDGSDDEGWYKSSNVFISSGIDVSDALSTNWWSLSLAESNLLSRGVCVDYNQYGTLPFALTMVGGNIRLHISECENMTEAEFKTWLSNNNIQLLYKKASPTPDTPIEPVVDPFLKVEGGGTIEPVQTNDPKIDGAMTVTYTNKVTA